MSNWGKAHENNTIGFGQGSANNSIGWGSVYDKSNSGKTILNPSLISPFEDATVAYSLRDLGLGTTNVVKVRRSTDNAEQDFTANEITDGTLTSFCGAGDGFVSVWYDQTGVYDASQTSALNQPKIVSLGNLVMDNGKPSLNFDTSDNLILPDNIVTNTNPISYFNVGFYTQSTSTGSMNILGNIGGADAIIITSEIAVRTGAGFKSFDSNANTVQSLVSLFFEGTEIKDFLVTKNGNLLNQSGLNNNTLDLGDNTTLKLYNGVSGKLSESILFKENKVNNREDIETNINNYYAIY